MFETKLSEPIQNVESDPGDYADLYSGIQSEISKLVQPLPGTIAWSDLNRDCIELLVRYVKDLNVAHYLVISTLEMENIDCMISAFQFLCHFVERNSKLMRPRIGKNGLREKSINWFFSTLEKFLDKKGKCIYNGSSIDEIVLWLERYHSQCLELMGLDVKLPKTLVEKLKSNIVLKDLRPLSVGSDVNSTTKQNLPDVQNTSVNAPQQKREEINETRDESILKNHSNLSKSIPLPVDNKLIDTLGSNISAENKVLHDCRVNLMALADVKLNRSIEEPSSYYIRRIAAWLAVNKLPDCNIAQETQLKTPGQFDKRDLNIALQASDHTKVVREAEMMLDRFPLWLDANIFTLNALKALGKQYEPCRISIISLLRDLLERFPDLRKLKFGNGELMFGIECQKTSGLSPTIIDKNTDDTTVDHSILEIDSDITSISTEGTSMEFDSQLRLRQTKMLSFKGLRHEFRSRIDQIQHCMRHQKFNLAIAQLDYLWTQVQKIEFASWEPTLASKLIELQLTAIMAVNPKDKEMNSVDKQRCKELYIHLSGLNACAASKLSTKHFE